MKQLLKLQPIEVLALICFSSFIVIGLSLINDWFVLLVVPITIFAIWLGRKL